MCAYDIILTGSYTISQVHGACCTALC